ncbi:MAG: hydroxymethylbilane synthase, partial [Synergistaceae bacterium]|nr:hydroxymethylbilane synthase [Synergistaceae bacterium]
MNHEIDFAVHSLKDLPVCMNSSLPIVAYSHRDDPRDALINRGGVIGTSSLRRKLQLERLYPDSKIIPVRGNVNSRIQKMSDNQYDALVLAAAGLKRLGLEDRITKIFSIDEIMPAPAQGILACQGRSDEDYGYLDCVNDTISRDCALAERSFSRALNAGCNVPIGAYASVHNDMLTLRGLYIDESTKRFHEGSITGRMCEAESLGERLAEVIMS